MKKTLLSIVTILVLTAVLTVSVFAAVHKQTYVYNNNKQFIKMTGSLSCDSPNGAYIRIGIPLTRTDIRGSAEVTESMYAVLNAQLYANYTAGPVSGTQRANVSSPNMVAPGNYVRQQVIFESNENIIKASSFHKVTFADGTILTCTQGQYLSYGEFIQDTSVESIG